MYSKNIMPRSIHNFYVANIALKGFVNKLLKGKKCR